MVGSVHAALQELRAGAAGGSLRIDVYHHFEDSDGSPTLEERLMAMALDISNLNAAIERANTIGEGLRQAYAKQDAMLKEALLGVGVTQAQIDEATSKITVEADKDAALLVANVPAPEPPAPVPAPPVEPAPEPEPPAPQP